MPNLINLNQLRQDQLVNAINTPINTATGNLFTLITGTQIQTGVFDNRFVHLTGNETISGLKSFQIRPIYSNSGFLTSGDSLSVRQTGVLASSGNLQATGSNLQAQILALGSGVQVTGSSFISNANFIGVGGAQVIHSGSNVLVSGGAGGAGGAGSGVSLLVATGTINSGGFTGNILLSGAGDVTITTGHQGQRVIVISGNTGGYVNFVSLSQTGGFLTLGNVGGVRTIQTTGTFPSGFVSGSVVISGVGDVTVTTGAAGQIVISGAPSAGGVTTLAATGTTNTGFFAGDVMLSGAGNVVVSTGTPINKLIVVSGNTGAYSNFTSLQNQITSLSGAITGGTLVINTGIQTITGVKNDISFYTPFSVTGFALQETFLSNITYITGYAIGCTASGVGGAHFTSGASGAILQYQMTGDFYQRTTGNTTGLIFNFGFNSGLLYKEGIIPTFVTVRNTRIGLNIYSGLSGIQNITFGIFGVYSGG